MIFGPQARSIGIALRIFIVLGVSLLGISLKGIHFEGLSNEDSIGEDHYRTAVSIMSLCHQK